jgi:hypothetical protein
MFNTEKQTEYHRKYSRKYRKEHREEVLTYQKKYYKEHREWLRLYRRKRYLEDREKAARCSQKGHWGLKIKLIDLFGGCCRMCGCSDPRVLQINHINGGGMKELKMEGKKFYRKILTGERSTKDLELLCANCNIIYEYEQGRRFKHLDLAQDN